MPGHHQQRQLILVLEMVSWLEASAYDVIDTIQADNLGWSDHLESNKMHSGIGGRWTRRRSWYFEPDVSTRCGLVAPGDLCQSSSPNSGEHQPHLSLTNIKQTIRSQEYIHALHTAGRYWASPYQWCPYIASMSPRIPCIPSLAASPPFTIDVFLPTCTQASTFPN